MKKFTALLLAIGAFALSSTASAVPIYADSLVDSQFVTSFGSGDVTGGADGGGLFLGDSFDPPTNPGYITVGFSGGLMDGAGDDIFVIDVASSLNELAEILVSNDNVSFTSIGILDAVNNSIDIAGIFTDAIYYVKIANATTTVSIDIDAVGGNYAAAVPEPMIVSLLSLGLVGIGVSRRMRKATIK